MVCFCLVGEGGFGPPKLKSNRFTVCPLWPLGNSSILDLLFITDSRNRYCGADNRVVAEDGAGGRTRTPDLLITNQLLYQLSYTSKSSNVIYSNKEE